MIYGKITMRGCEQNHNLCSIYSKKTREVILLDKQVMQLNVREIVTQIAMKQIVVMRVEMRSR